MRSDLLAVVVVPAMMIARVSLAAAASLDVTSTAFEAGKPIPKEHGCDGRDVSPQLRWSTGPVGTVSYAIILEDPDAPGGTFVHWLLYDYVFDPAVTLSLPLPNLAQGVPKSATVSVDDAAIGGRPPGSLKQGTNDFGRIGYAGPCPPPGRTHHYRFEVFALDRRLTLAPGASGDELRRAMAGHVLAKGRLTGTFRR